MKKISTFGTLLIVILFAFFIAMPTLLEHRDNSQASEGVNTDEVDLAHTEEVIEIGLMQMMEHPSLDTIRQGFYDGLAERGYVDGENIEIEFENGQGEQSNFKMIADSFMAQDKDILVGIATPAVQALDNAAQGEVPVIMGAVSDPIGAGLMQDTENPGGNVTGVSDHSPIEEQLSLMMEIQPGVEALGVIYNSSEVNVLDHVEHAMDYAENELGIRAQEATITSTNDLAQVAEQLAGEVDAIWVPNDNTIASSMPTLIQVTDSYGVPVYPVVDAMVAQGGLATIGISQHQLGVDTGHVTADIIEGADPATYPVQYTTKTDLYYNSDSAERLEIELPKDVINEGTDLAEEESPNGNDH